MELYDHETVNEESGIFLLKGEKQQSSMKLHSPKTAAQHLAPHGFQHHGDPSLQQGRPLINQPIANQVHCFDMMIKY